MVTRLSKAQKKHLDDVLKARGQDFKQWLVAQVERCASERLPESQGGHKRVVPPWFAKLARVALRREANIRLELAKEETEPERRSRLRRLAGAYMDAADWAASAVEEVRYRKHLITSGQVKPRHRTASAPERDTDQD